MKIDPLAQTLDDEFKRVARDEDLPMEQLVDETAALTGLSPRQLYNYRSGKWPIPARIIPILSRRFQSTALLTVLRGQTNETCNLRIANCDSKNIGERALDLLRLTVNHHSSLLNRIDASEFDANDLHKLEETTERIVQGERELYACAEIEYERRQAERRRA